MHEFHEQDTGDDADTGTDTRPDAAAGHSNDSRRPAIATVRDSTTRITLALEYRQLVKGAEGAYATSGAAGAASRTIERTTLPACPVRATASLARRLGGIPGSWTMITAETRVPRTWPGGRREEPTFL